MTTTQTKPPHKTKPAKTLTRPYDVAEHLRTPEEMALYLDACIIESDSDPSFVAKALGDIARAKGMTALAKETGLGRESLYKALSSEGNPELGTVLKVTRALGVRLAVVPV
ncbi:MAG: putative addiction module antidote protein [Pseudomonadales bacterium]|jgi:probable addiction module antidote protein|nr:putative addiction module antidote protein [Pseudomonadales bacterium]